MGCPVHGSLCALQVLYLSLEDGDDPAVEQKDLCSTGVDRTGELRRREVA
jgi:hypothetical protein